MNQESLKHNCSHVVPGACVPYEGEIPEWSELSERRECVTVGEVLEDIYKAITEIREAIDVRDIGDDCVAIDGDKTIAKAFYALESKVCSLS